MTPPRNPASGPNARRCTRNCRPSRSAAARGGVAERDEQDRDGAGQVHVRRAASDRPATVAGRTKMPAPTIVLKSPAASPRTPIARSSVAPVSEGACGVEITRAIRGRVSGDRADRLPRGDVAPSRAEPEGERASKAGHGDIFSHFFAEGLPFARQRLALRRVRVGGERADGARDVTVRLREVLIEIAREEGLELRIRLRVVRWITRVPPDRKSAHRGPAARRSSAGRRARRWQRPTAAIRGA